MFLHLPAALTASMMVVCVSFCFGLWWSPGKVDAESSNTSQLTCSPLFSFTIWPKRVNSSECSTFFCFKYLYLHFLIMSFNGGCSMYSFFKPELCSLGVDIRTSEWSNDRSLKCSRTLQSLSLCSSVKSSGCRTSRNTWGPGSEALTQSFINSVSLCWEMLVCSRSPVLTRTISFSFNCPLTLRQHLGALLNTVSPSMKFPTCLLSDQLFPSRTTLSSDTVRNKDLEKTEKKDKHRLAFIIFFKLLLNFRSLVTNRLYLWNTVNSDIVKQITKFSLTHCQVAGTSSCCCASEDADHLWLEGNSICLLIYLITCDL